MNVSKYIEETGEKWYLRDFDYLPDRLSDKLRFNQSYDTYSFYEGIIKGNFVLFNTEKEATEKSIKVRELLGLETEWLKERLKKI